MIIKRLYKLKQAFKLKQLYKTTSLFAIALLLGVTSLTVLIAPTAMAYPGELDNTFNTGGSGFDGIIYNAMSDSSGRIVVIGNYSSYNNTPAGGIIRLNKDGSIDHSFVSGSGLTGSWNGSFTGHGGGQLAIQTDGKIIVSGIFRYYNGVESKGLVRLNIDGTIDNTFAIGDAFSGYYGISATTIQSDGKVLIGGFFSNYKGNLVNHITRINSDGSYDSTFNTGSLASNSVFDIQLDTTQKIVVTGNYSSSLGNIARLNSDGSLDTSFNSGTGFNGNTFISKFQKDGKILITGGNYNSYNGQPTSCITRLNTDGSLDNSFNISQGCGSKAVLDLYIKNDNTIIAVGDFVEINGNSIGRITHILSDGTVDFSFGNPVGFNVGPRTLVVTDNNDTKIIAFGQPISYNGTPVGRIARLHLTDDKDNDGIIDTQEDSTANAGDANNDGTLDSNQNNVSSFINPITNKTSSIQVDPTCTLSSLSTKEESNQNNQDDTYSYPLGLYDFTASCGTPGYTTQVKLYNYDTPNTTSYITRKYNPNTKLYSDLTGSYLEDITINNQTVKVSNYSLTDGSDNDTDGLTNGIIVDPVGLATITTTTTNTTPMAPNTGVGMNSSNKQDTTRALITTLTILLSVTVATVLRYTRHNKRL